MLRGKAYLWWSVSVAANLEDLMRLEFSSYSLLPVRREDSEFRARMYLYVFLGADGLSFSVGNSGKFLFVMTSRRSMLPLQSSSV